MKLILMRPDFANTEYMAVLADEWSNHEFATPITPIPSVPSAPPPPPGAADASKVAAADADHVG